MVGYLKRRRHVPMRIPPERMEKAAGVTVRYIADCEDHPPKRRILTRPEKAHLTVRAQRHKVKSVDPPQGLLEALSLLELEAGRLVDYHPLAASDVARSPSPCGTPCCGGRPVAGLRVGGPVGSSSVS